jgi:pyruvate formate lyase activating enzyme
MFAFASKVRIVECRNCHQESTVISQSLGLCANCIKKDFEKVLPEIEETHASTRERFNLPKMIPKSSPGTACNICAKSMKRKCLKLQRLSQG